MAEPPIILLGAARSGTKALRDALGAHPDLATVPYDINFVWKYGNYDVPHDELRRDQAWLKSKRLIRERIERYRRHGGGQRVVEKTVGNTLRAEFVREVFPRCRFVHLIRDGRDVAESARRQWQKPMDVRAVLPKLRAFPMRALPRYATQYVAAYAGRRVSKEEHAGTWGPRFKGIDEAVRDLPLLEVCALQWLHCVERAQEQLAEIPKDDIVEIRYEAFAEDPKTAIANTFEALGLPPSSAAERQAEATIVAGNIGKWKKSLSAAEIETLEELLGDDLRELGYS